MLKKLLMKILRRVMLPLFEALTHRTQTPSVNQQIQTSLMTQWILAKRQNVKVFSEIQDAGFRCYSEFEEDGIILYLLSLIDARDRTVVEMCCGSGDECMAANLIINHGFKGHLFEGDKFRVRNAKNFFSRQKDCRCVKPNITHAWITKSNVNDLIKASGVAGEVDVFSLDVDGNDYHIWEAVDVIQPRICVFETHDIVPTDLAVTVPYSDDFVAMDKTGAEKDFRSASLAAMDKLSRSKGYTLVGSHKHGFNVFYVRNDLLNQFLPRPTLESIHDNEWTRDGQKNRWPLVKEFPWVEV